MAGGASGGTAACHIFASDPSVVPETDLMATQAVPALPPTSFALSEHRTLRVAVLFLLYVAQGLPFGLIDYGLPAWLAQNGASAAAIGGVLAMIILPWTFKLAYGFIMDRYAFLAMGRRRPWIIVGQLGLVAALELGHQVRWRRARDVPGSGPVAEGGGAVGTGVRQGHGDTSGR